MLRSPAAVLLALVALAIGGLPARPGGLAEAGDPAPGEGAVPAGQPTWTAPDGRAFRFYRPRFVPASDLASELGAFAIEGADVRIDLGRGRLLLGGGEGVAQDLLEALDFLDVPNPQALVRVRIVETLRRVRSQSGGHALYDRGEGGPDTLFRGFRSDFEPEDWLRSELVGGSPFQGTSVRFGSSPGKAPFEGESELVWRMLSRGGEAQVLAEPSLLCTEGEPAFVEAAVLLPTFVIAREGGTLTGTPVAERTGVRLEVLVERVGTDHVRVRIHPWLRYVADSEGGLETAPFPTLAVREASTRIVVPDGTTALVGGLESMRRARDRRGLPGFEAAGLLDGLVRAKDCEGYVSDLVFEVTVRIVTPGRAPCAPAPPGEAERLRAVPSRARVVK